MYRQSWIEIDLDALRYNVKIIRQNHQGHLIGVVKANAYGCGDRQIVSTLIDDGVQLVAVSSLDEAIYLHDYHVDILVLGEVEPKDISLMNRDNIVFTVPSLDWIKQFDDKLVHGCRAHIKINTGMNRLGINTLEELKCAVILLKEKGVIVEGIYTHLSSSDSDISFTLAQLDKFDQFVDSLDFLPQWIHAFNSGAVMNQQITKRRDNAYRSGLAMYGCSSENTDLRQVMSLKSKICHISNVKKGDYIGYSHSYLAERDMKIGVVPIGYADGWIRANQGRYVIVNGEKCEIIGRVCMDMFMIKVSEETQVGDVVELFGKQIPLSQVAQELDTISYEVMTLLSDRLPRVYIEGESEKVINAARFRKES